MIWTLHLEYFLPHHQITSHSIPHKIYDLYCCTFIRNRRFYIVHFLGMKAIHNTGLIMWATQGEIIILAIFALLSIVSGEWIRLSIKSFWLLITSITISVSISKAYCTNGYKITATIRKIRRNYPTMLGKYYYHPDRN